MGVMGTTNISLNSAQQLFGAASGTQRNINDTNVRYLAGIPNSASDSQINMNKLSGAGYFTKSSAGTALNVRSDCVANGWNQTGPVWYIINGTVYSNSTGTASITISGSFPNGLVLQINSGVIVTGFGGAGGIYGYAYSYTPGVGGTGGVAIAVSGYSGGTLYIKNDGTIAGGGGGGAGGGGGHSNYYYFSENFAGGGGGGGAAYGAGGQGYNSLSARYGSAGGLTTGGSGGTRDTTYTYSLTSVAGGAGGGSGSAGTSTYHTYFGTKSGGGAGACTTGTVAAGVVWLANGTRYGTIG